MTLEELFSKRLIVVTGKGGVGKTTLSLSLAFLNAAHGRRSIVAFSDRIKGVRGVAAGVGRTMSRERKLSDRVYGITIYPDKALEDYLKKRFVMAAPFYNSVFRLKALECFFEAMPGLKELVTLGKVWDLGNQKRRGGGDGSGPFKYDQVIFDAPSSGHAMPLLKVPHNVLKLVKSGPFREHVVWVEGFINNPEMTALVTVATPEEMARVETEEIIAQAGEIGIAHAFCVLNRFYPERFTEGEGEAVQALAGEGAGGNEAVIAARWYLERERLSKKYAVEIAELVEGGVVMVGERFKAGLDLEDVRGIAAELEGQLSG